MRWCSAIASKTINTSTVCFIDMTLGGYLTVKQDTKVTIDVIDDLPVSHGTEKFESQTR